MISEGNLAPEAISFRLRKVRRTHQVRSAAGDSVVTSLDDATLDIPAGTCVAVLGHSGSGKSTLLHLLGLLDTFDQDGAEGEADIVFQTGAEAFSYRSLSESQRNALRRDRFGFVFQSHGLLSHLSCEENVSLGLGIAGQSKNARRVAASRLLSSIHLDRLVGRRPKELSGGESQRVALLRAIAHEPQVLLADEPTGSLDAANADVVMQQLISWQGCGDVDLPRTLILITHDVARAYQVCDRFLILHSGKALEGRVWHREEVGSAERLNQLLTQPLYSANGVTSQRERRHNTESSSKSFQPKAIRWSYLRQLAISDLLHHPLIALANLAMLVASVALVFMACALFRGKTLVMERELGSAGALSLDVSANGSRTGSIDSTLYSQLRHLRREERVLWPEGRPVYRWNMFSQQFFRGDQGRPERLVDIRQVGRSLEFNDPILDEFDSVVAGLSNRFSSENAQEIVVSTAFLKKASYPLNAGEVWLHIKNAPVPLKVVKVAERLPGGYSFVIPDGLFQQWQDGEFDPNPEVVLISLEPIPQHLQQASIGLLREMLGEFQLRAEPTKRGIDIRTLPGRALPQDEMVFLVGKLREKLEADTTLGIRGAQMTLPPRPPVVWREPQFMRATLSLASYDEVIAAGAALTAMGLEHDDKKVAAYETLKKTIEPLQGILRFIILGAIVVSGLNLLITISLRVAQKRLEIGILKAFGLSARNLSTIFGIQGLFLGSIAVCIGLVAGAYFGMQFAEANHDALLFAPDTVMVSMIGGIAILLTIFMCVLATWWEAKLQPAKVVR